MKARQQAADGFCRHLREWFTAFLPRQRGAAENTITSCRQTWNMLLGYVAEHHHAGVEKVTFTMVDRATVTGFLDHMQAACRQVRVKIHGIGARREALHRRAGFLPLRRCPDSRRQ